jgi:hypothetical protein
VLGAKLILGCVDGIMDVVGAEVGDVLMVGAGDVGEGIPLSR